MIMSKKVNKKLFISLFVQHIIRLDIFLSIKSTIICLVDQKINLNKFSSRL